MALKIWLPLNGNINNSGVSNTSVTGNTTINSSGKIGKCYSFNGSDQYIEMTCSEFPTILNGDFTVCFWISSNDTGDRSIYFGNWSMTGSFFNIEKTASNKLRFYWNGSPDYNATLTIADSNWHHIAVGKSGTNIRTYLDGSLVDNYTGTFTGSIPSNATVFRLGRDARSDATAFNGKMNDFRLYNHFLSANEVREISKGLALHWTCNKSGTGKDNIVPGSSANEASYTYPSSSYSDKWTATTSIVPSASQYILSFWAKSTVNGDKVRSHWYSPNTTTKCESSQGTVTTATDGTMDYTLSNDWKFYWCVYTQSETTAVKHLIFPRLWSGNGTGTVSVKCVKLEEGNVPTPWRPNSNDNGYSTFGYNSTVERDLSGLQRDGTLVSAFPTVEAGAPRYSCSYKYAGNVNNAHYNTTTELNYTDNFSWSIWVKTNYTGSTAQYVFTVGRADAGGYGYGLSNTSTTACTVRFGNASWGVNVTGGEWTHIGFTKSGTTIKIYKNGNLYSTNTFSGTLPTYSDGNGVGIGCFHYSGNIYPYYGNISDFRIYATALSDDDMKRLYSTAASISNNGVMMAYEFIEE